MASSPDDLRRERQDADTSRREQPIVDTRESQTTGPVKAKTSAAAVFALVFGLSSLIVALLVVLAPVAIVFGVIALVLGIVGLGKAKQRDPGAGPIVTGRGVAISGLILGVLGLLLGVAVVAGAATFLADRTNVNRIEQGLQELRSELPTELPT
jgi:hypothetical protein